MINIKKIKPLFTRILTTAEIYSIDELEGIVINPKQIQGSLKEYLKVIAVGDAVREIKEGDLVKIDPSRYAVKKYKENSLKDGVVTSNPVISYNFNTLEVDGRNCLLLQENDIEYIVLEKEEAAPNKVISTKKDIIL